ncbi:hypothetical protein EIP75_21655 [Aquabacterium soli]|uniref:Transcriptional regulator n=1 Tax=Aquabacterium soli TaxID=2493092 RepID=A0A3R8YK09_9BURK|nr:hypothetical protein EIP75_21655 [Aquabacterium soli]
MSNRDRYQQLLTDHGLTQAQSAEVISKITLRPCSVRTVRAWLADSDKPSSRPCPDWAVSALLRGLAEIKLS